MAYFNMFVGAETLKGLKGSNLSIEMEKHPIGGTKGYEYWMAVEDGEIVIKTNVPAFIWYREADDTKNHRHLRNAIVRFFNYNPELTFMGVGIEPQTQNVAFQFFPRQDVFLSSPR